MGLVDHLFGFGRVVASKVSGKANAVLVNLRLFEANDEDPNGEEAPEEPFFGTAGVFCRPDPPTPDGYAEVVALRLSDGARPMSSRDLRLSARVNPKEGELGLSHYGGGFLSLKWNTDHTGTTATLMAPVLQPGAGGVLGAVEKSHAIILDTSEANNAVGVIHMDGMAMMMTKEGVLVLKSNNGTQRIEISDAGTVIQGVLKLFGGIAAGNTTTAVEVALYPALGAYVAALATWAAGVDAALASVLKAPAPEPAPGPLGGALIAAAAARTAAETVMASPAAQSKTLKASPV